MAEHLEVLIVGTDSRNCALEHRLEHLEIKGSGLGTIEQFSAYGVQLIIPSLFLGRHFFHTIRVRCWETESYHDH